MYLRSYEPTDCKTLPELFYNTVHAVNARDSFMPGSFFESRGYRVIKEQQVARYGVKLTYFVMERCEV